MTFDRFVHSSVGGVLCIALTLAILYAGKVTIGGRDSASTPDLVLETPDAEDMPDLAEAGEDVVPAVAGPELEPDETTPKTVPTPGAVTTAPLDAPLDAPPQAGSGTGLTTAVLRHPVALSAGLIQFEDRMVQLDGLKPQSAERVCETGGRQWPCGMQARTAFRNFLRARSLVCQVPKDGWSGTVSGACVVGNDDPALWLAENGWAEAEPGTLFESVVETARSKGKGFYRPTAPATTTPAAPDLPPAPDTP